MSDKPSSNQNTAASTLGHLRVTAPDAVALAEAEAVRTALDALRERVEAEKDGEWRDCLGNCHDHTLAAVLRLIDEARP